MRILWVIFLAWQGLSALSFSDCTKKFATLSKSAATKSTPSITAIFKSHFQDHYADGDCFENTVRFLKEATALSPSQFFLVSIENRGASTLGMVHATQARGVSHQKVGSGWVEIPASVEKKWYHHVFSIDQDSNVYDFDFSKRPKIIPLTAYLKSMFLEVSADLHKKKLDDYEITISRAHYVLENKLDPKRRVMSLRDFLKEGL